MKTLILGKGYVGSALSTSLPEVTWTNRQKKHPGSLTFDLNNETTWKNIQPEQNIVWTFPAMPLEKVQKFYHEKLVSCPNLIVLASTSRYKVKRQKEKISELSDIDKNLFRVQGEEFLRQQGATILALAGIYGPNRDPKTWLFNNLIRNPDKVVNLIHIEDIVFTINHLLMNPQKGECINLSDGIARTWREIGEKCNFHFRMDGEREVSKILCTKKIKAILPENYTFKNLYSLWN